jgi:hypothetical protein
MSAATNYRTMTDPQGVLWEVWEAHPLLSERRILRERRAAIREGPSRRAAVSPLDARLQAALAAGWLVLRSIDGRRRRFPIPDRWEVMSEEELRGVLLHARTTGPQPRVIIE